MKRILSIFVALVCVALCAVGAQKIYINPGHGSFTGDSRPMGTIAYPLKSNGLPDTLGFYESNTNLWKSLYLRDKLNATGKYSVKMSRTKNGGSQNGTYNKPLSTIASEAANWGGYFISIHSNAASEGTTTNYLLLIHRGYNSSATNSGSIPFEKAIWKRMFKIHEAGFEYSSHYSMTNMNIKGGLSMNGWDYGVLRHSRPGTLSEGYFHTYQPARHRALNPDWCCQEGVRYFRGIQDYFGYGKESKGYIMGAVRTKDKQINQTYYKGRAGNDIYYPINGSKIVLRNSNDEVVKTNCYPYVKRMKKNQSYYTTDNNYNGIFVFSNLAPGTYTLYIHTSGYKDVKKTVTVTKDETTYLNIFVTAGTGTSPNVGDINPDIEWVLNGGIVPGASVPTNAKLWESFMTYFNKYYGLSRATQDITAASTFMTKACEIMTKSNSEYDWLGKYIMQVSGEQGITLTNDPNADGMEALWRWSVHSFFNCNQHTTWPQTANFATAGKPAQWDDAYNLAYGKSKSLPTAVTETYTLPTPIKDGYRFGGWFDNKSFTGTALTTIPAKYKGTLYAKWENKEPEVKWELNGGKVAEAVKVPTNDSLWNAFKPYYNTYYGLNRADQPIEGVATFAASLMADIMTNTKSEYKWLGDYIANAALGMGVELEKDETKWRWHVHCFFNCNDGTIQGDQKVATADFTSAGKPSAWGPAYQAKYGAGVKLPEFITSPFALPTPTKQGYKFVGWFNNNNGTGDPLTVLPVGYKGTVYAIWEEAVEADVHWFLNGGSVGSTTLPAKIETEYTIPTPSKSGYIFLGWYDNAAGSGTALTKLPVGYKGNIYAIWKEAKVTWVLNGGKVYEMKTVTSSVKVPTNDSLWTAFKPYYNKYYGLNRADQPITAVATFAAAKMCDIMTNSKSEYKWLGDYITKVAKDQGYTLSSDAAAEGMEALWRWHVDAFFNCNQHTTYPKTADFSTAGKPSAWGSAYQAAHGSVTTTEKVEVTLPTKITKEYTIPTPEREGFTFIGWFDDEFGQGNKLTKLPVGYDGVVYAIWNDNLVDTDVKWELNGGKIGESLPESITEEYTIPAPHKEGYVFLGWYDNAAGTGNAIKVLPVGYKGVLYAIWREATVTWVLNGGRVVEIVTTTTPGKDVKVPTQDELWNSYKTAAGITALGTLAELKTAGEGKPHNAPDNQCACRLICAKLAAANVQTAFGKAEWKWLQTYIQGVQSDLTDDLTAAAWRYAIAAFFLQSQHSAYPASADFSTAGKPEKWGPAYQKANGGGEGTTTTTEKEVTLPTKITGSDYLIPTPVKEGVSFIGWFESANGTGNPITVLPVGYDGTVYAIWSDNVIDGDVVWVLNGGTTEEILPTTITEDYTIPTPKKEGHIFLGWYDNANGTGTAVTVVPVGYKGTIYAIWREAKVTWVLNGGKVGHEVVNSGTSTVVVPTNDSLWSAFKVYFNKYYNLARADQPITAVTTFWPYTSVDPEVKILTDAKSEFKWLGDYILKVATAQGYTLEGEELEAQWRWHLHCFFNCNKHEAWPYTADFATAGKPEAWGPAYQAAHGGGTTTTWQDTELPTSIVGKDYVIPTPVKDGDTFLGWYDNNDGQGDALTVLPVGYDGTVYAIWKSMGTATGVENTGVPTIDLDAPMYDILGRPVDATYRGIIIQKGNKYLLR